MGTSATTRLLLVAGAAAAVVFVLVFTVDGATRPGYSPTRMSVSALSLGDRGWVQITNFIVAGSLLGAFSIGVRRRLQVDGSAGRGPLLLAVFAGGLVASGAFVMDPTGSYPPGSAADGPASWHGVAHDVAAVFVFVPLPAAAFVLARRFGQGRYPRWLATVSLITGALIASSCIAFVVADEAGSAVAGLLQRVTIITGWGWLALVAVTLVSMTPKDTR